MRSVTESIGRQLRRRRTMLGLTQQELGVKVGVRFQQIQKYECGGNKISADRLFQLSEALGVPPNYFFEECKKVQEFEDAHELDRHSIEIVTIAESLTPKLRFYVLKIMRALVLTKVASEAS